MNPFAKYIVFLVIILILSSAFIFFSDIDLISSSNNGRAAGDGADTGLDLIATSIGQPYHFMINNSSLLYLTKENGDLKILREDPASGESSGENPFYLKMGRIKYFFSDDDIRSRLTYDYKDLFKTWKLHDVRLRNFDEDHVNLKVTGPNPLLLFRQNFRFEMDSYIAVELRYKITLNQTVEGQIKGRIYWDYFDEKRNFENEKSISYEIPDNSEFNTYRVVIPNPVDQPSQVLRFDLVALGIPATEIQLDYIKVYEYQDPLIGNKDFVSTLKNSDNFLRSDILIMNPGEKIQFDKDISSWKNLKIIYSLLSFPGEGKAHLRIKSGEKELEDIKVRKSEVLYVNLDKSGDKKTESRNLRLEYDAPENAPPLVINNAALYRETDHRPNVVLIILDTLRADHLGCYGYDKNTSPNLDAFAAENVLYQNAFSQAPLTPPSHGSIFTSLYPDQHKALKKLLEEFPTLAEVMNKHGYYTTATTGGVFLTRGLGFMQGFDRVQPFDDEWLLSRKYEARFNINRAVADLEYFKGPFFMLLHTYQIHSPYIHPEQFDIFYEQEYKGTMRGYLYDNLAKFSDDPLPGWRALRKIKLPEEDRKRIVSFYDQGIRYTDNELQGLFNYLKKKDYYDDSMIIITSDHGEEFFDHGSWEHGHSLYNEIVKVPLIVKYPKHMNMKHKVVKDYVELIDIMPTILKTAGISVKFHMEGNNLLAGPKKNKEALSIMIDPDGEVFKSANSGRNGRFKFIHTMDKEVPNDLKYFYMKPAAYNEIFDLKDDYGERKNLYDSAAGEKTDEILKNQYDTWLTSRGEQENFKWAEKALGVEAEPEIDDQLRDQFEALGYVQ